MEKLQALKKQAEELAAAMKAVEAEEKKAREEAWKAYEFKWEYTCKWGRSYKSDPIALRITASVVKDAKYEEMVEKYGQWRAKDDEVRRSVGYVRDEEGMLSHIGGGYLVLEDGVPISKEDWELLKAGDLATITKNLWKSKW